MQMDYHKDLGTALVKTGDVKGAKDAYSKALSLDPNNIHTLNNLGVLYLNSHDHDNAIITLEKALKFVPNNIELLVNLGKAYYSCNNLEKAEHCFLTTLNINSKYSPALYNLGLLYKKQKSFDLAHQTFKKALSINDNDCHSWNEVGKLLNISHERDKAIRCFEKALEINPNELEYNINLLHALEKSGEIDLALKRINSLLNSEHKERPELVEIRSIIARKKGDPNKAIKLIKEALSKITDVNYRHASLYFSLGAACDEIKDSHGAFNAIKTANQLSSQSPDVQLIDYNSFPNLIDDLVSFCSSEKDWINTRRNIESEYKDPVFLVGFPRSGTTLLETILKSHKSINVSEEISAIGRVYKFTKENFADNRGYIKKLSPQQVNSLRNLYFETIELHGDYLKCDLFIDKNPLNMVYAPFIKAVFPNARFILALRHPKDCVLSCFMQDFEYNRSLIHFLDLNNAAKLYNAVFTAWSLYKDNLSLSVYEHRYEDLIDNFEESTKAIISFLDLPWDENINTYYKNAQKDSNIYTPSYSQVTKQIYTSSTRKWERYNSQMLSVSDALDSWVTKLGY
jgi:tetratricopeptide (TPR) repeat protein